MLSSKGYCGLMILGTRAILCGMARQALVALLAVVSLLAPVTPLAARQLADWTRGVACGMECCKRIGRCCCGRKPGQAAPISQAAFTARECPSGCGSSAQPTQSGSNLFTPGALSIAVYSAPSSLLLRREAGSFESSRLASSLRQRPPPSSSF